MEKVLQRRHENNSISAPRGSEPSVSGIASASRSNSQLCDALFPGSVPSPDLETRMMARLADSFGDGVRIHYNAPEPSRRELFSACGTWANRVRFRPTICFFPPAFTRRIR